MPMHNLIVTDQDLDTRVDAYVTRALPDDIPSRMFVKKLMDAGRLTVNGHPLNETYLAAGTPPSTIRFDTVVPAGRLWVMGDNRSDSADSRAHLGDPGGGTVPLDHIVGRVVAVWWPFDRLTGVGAPDAARTTTTG